MSNFICPVKNARLTSPFGWRTISGKKEWHQGIDLASTGKVPIYASADGIVVRVGPLSTYGNIVMIRHTINGKRMDTNYAHLDSYYVKVGQKVKQGQQIGVMGNTGRSSGIHLHFEIHNGAWATGQPNAIDPMKYINLKNDAIPVSNSKPKTEVEEPEMTQFLNDTGRSECKQMIRRGVDEKLFSDMHEDINKYTDIELLSYAMAYQNRKLKTLK